MISSQDALRTWFYRAEDIALSGVQFATEGNTEAATLIRLVSASRTGDMIARLSDLHIEQGRAGENAIVSKEDVLEVCMQMLAVKRKEIPLVSHGQGDYRRETFAPSAPDAGGVQRALIARKMWNALRDCMR